MNTLFSFHEELTEIEIANFVNALYERALTGEIAEAFADAQEKIRDYPHCTPLLYTCATLLSASLTPSAVPPEGREKYNARIRDWFTRASESDDANYRTAACYQLAMLEITEGNYDRAEELVARLRASEPESFVLMLAHRAYWAEKYPELDVDLILCGHTHGGIVRLPLVGGLAASNMGLFPEYDAGLFELPAYKLFISRGLGNSVPLPRFLNTPEIVSITLRTE